MFFSLFLIVPLVASIAFGQDSRDFKGFINPSIDPCEDFYEYACGKWTPQNAEAADVIADQRQENRQILKSHYRTLREKSASDEHPPSKLYYLCLNSKLQSDDEILSNYLGTLLEYSDWPYLNASFDGSSFDWLQVAAKLRHHQVDTLFKLSIQRNWMDSAQHIFYLTTLKKPFEGPADGDDAFMYQTYVKYLLLAFGVKVRKANEFAQEVVDFEYALDSLNRDVEDVLIDPITLDNLIEQFPEINWELYFETLLNRSVKRSQLIIVQVNLFKNLEKLLRRTKPETIALYQLAKFLRHYQVKMDPPNWIDCIDEVNEKMPLSIANDFQTLSPTFISFKVREVFESLRKEFITQINQTNWYSNKSEIIDKLEDLRAFIGTLEDAVQLDAEVKIDQQNYQQARMALDNLAAINEFDQLQYPAKTAANTNLRPLYVNAYYKLTSNALEIPIGLLRPPLYREQSTVAQVMGSLGSIFGHELVHGFDYDGQNYDQNGNVKMDVNPKDIIQFGLRANCFMDQYSGGRVGALNEDVADNEGLRLAFSAYEKMDDKTMDASGFSGKQLFFVSYAQIWCRTKESSSKSLNHSPHKDRVNNVVANAEKFAEAFSCQSGSKLNPVKKCQIW